MGGLPNKLCGTACNLPVRVISNIDLFYYKTRGRNDVNKVLQLDIAGNPINWISHREGIRMVAANQEPFVT